MILSNTLNSKAISDNNLLQIFLESNIGLLNCFVDNCFLTLRQNVECEKCYYIQRSNKMSSCDMKQTCRERYLKLIREGSLVNDISMATHEKVEPSENSIEILA